MFADIDQLTFKAVPKLLEADSEQESVIVQVYEIIATKSGRLSSYISDGSFFVKAFITDDSVVKPGKDENAIICIKSHGSLKTCIGITDLKKVGAYPEKIGKPVEWIQNMNSENVMTQKHKLDLLQRKPEKKSEPKQIKKAPPPSEPIPVVQGNSSQYETINDLHVGLRRWTILCRLVRKILKQTPKKAMKVLEIQLIDKSKTKIIGTFFNEAAIEFNQFLRQNAVYEISRGRLKEGNYNQSKNDKFSPYTITFDSKSTFNEVSDGNLIAKNQDTAVSLGQAYQQGIFNQQFDIIAYLLEIKEESTYEKDNKTKRVREIVLADPQQQITMSGRLWSWNQELSDEMLNRVMVFNRFTFHEYKGSISLSSTPRSSISEVTEHHMKKYDGEKIDVQNYKAMTEVRERKEQDISDYCKNIHELKRDMESLNYGDVMKSVINVWLARMALSRKWSYEACPKCKKAAEKYSKCMHCETIIEETDPKLLMGVEMADPYGSIWLTAYQELGRRIFYDIKGSIVKQLQSLSPDEMGESVEKYLYQPFRLKIVTKKDSEGRIRHNASQLYDIYDEKCAQTNLEMITELMK